MVGVNETILTIQTVVLKVTVAVAVAAGAAKGNDVGRDGKTNPKR